MAKSKETGTRYRHNLMSLHRGCTELIWKRGNSPGGTAGGWSRQQPKVPQGFKHDFVLQAMQFAFI